MIENVTDTALWVATYRAQETERPDGLFKDPLAGILAGPRGLSIAKSIKGSKYTAWSVVIRTYIIDQFLQNLLAQGITKVINLGAGLDTRPYRLQLPRDLKWIEVDFSSIIDLKNERLKDETPRCQLERISLDLSDQLRRQQFLKEMAPSSENVLVLTEGVIPYLSNDEVSKLAEDLRLLPSVRYWILDYFSLQVLKYMKKSQVSRHMKNAPFLFDPGNWFDFFSEKGWKLKEMKYLPLEAKKLRREIPIPWIAKLLRPFLSQSKRDEFLRFTGYAILEK